ncbi:MAG TPA: L,D-transpeptidase family protein [Ktedonobacteraceae bacterium]|nr:L,D-transpeptidase family protein [Ktedonobacteraceae bacterium]
MQPAYFRPPRPEHVPIQPIQFPSPPRAQRPPVAVRLAPPIAVRSTRKRRKAGWVAGLAFLILGGIVISGTVFLSSAYPTSMNNILHADGTVLARLPDSLSSSTRKNIQEKLQQFEKSIEQIQQAGGDVQEYQQRLQAEQDSIAHLATQQDYIAFLIQNGKDLGALQNQLAQQNAQQLLNNFQDEATHWGNAHKYHDTYDGKEYYVNISYLSVDGGNGFTYGEGAYMRREVLAGTPQVTQDIDDDYFLHAMLEANYEDATPFNQPHAVDQALLDHFAFQNGQVLIVSLTEQAMRVYRNGHLEKATLVTTGRGHRPTPVGHFQMTNHFYNLYLISSDPPGSPDHYATVVVANAIQFWDNGYYIHSAQWRHEFGPFTQFPHQDSSGDAEANDGSHGCVNAPPAFLSQLDASVTTQTRLIIF